MITKKESSFFSLLLVIFFSLFHAYDCWYPTMDVYNRYDILSATSNELLICTVNCFNH